MFLVFSGKNYNQYQEKFVNFKKLYFSIINAWHRIAHHNYQCLNKKSAEGCRGAPTIQPSLTHNTKHEHKDNRMEL